MRIAFDLDGVLADMDTALTRIAGAAAAPDQPPPVHLSQFSPREQSRLWKRVHDTRDFWETLDECEPGIVGRIQALAHDRRWDVLFVTQRPASIGRTTQLQSQHWLRRHGFEYPAVYTTEGSRGRIAAALTLDVHVDDRLEHCVDVATESRTWPVLVWRDETSFPRVSANAAKLGIAAIATVGDALGRIEEADRRGGHQEDHVTLRRRLRRAFSGR